MTHAPQARRSVFSTKTVIILVLVGVFSFSAMMTLMTFAPELRPDGRGHALSRSAIGFAAAVELEKARGRTISISRSPESDMKAPLLVLTPDMRGIDINSFNRIAGNRTLVILPKWFALPRPDRPEWVMRASPIPSEAVASLIGDLAGSARIEQATGASRPRLHFSTVADQPIGETPFAAGEIESLQTIASPDLEAIVSTEDGKIILGRVTNTDLYTAYILSDPDLLNTHGLGNIETARAGMRILDALHQPEEAIVFDVTLNGYARSRDPMRLALEPPLLGATLSLVMAAMLLGWRAVAHQTPELPERRAIALGKRALAENSAALIRLARREHSMGGRYAELIAAVTIDQLGIGKREIEDVPGLLDRVAAHGGVNQKFSDLAVAAAGTQNPQELLEAAKKLHTWNEEVVRATR